MIDNAELGYTPANLKALRQQYGLTQQDVANITKVSLATAQRWEASPKQKSYASMPHQQWLILMGYVVCK
ncbi:helix-turn-helix domain-containing protein [Neisseria sicca]|uniref:helix-turn-helix domain-containing protein n=1 Tax=Neisseria sicca TaxID=490 RepID=UPI0003632E2C|nr:helix-turn-helix transcriptional regulator [Neisseria sicca]